MNLIILYVVSLLICVSPMVIYLTTDLANGISKDTLDGAKIAFILGFVPFGNTLLAAFMVIFIIVSFLYDFLNELIENKYK